MAATLREPRRISIKLGITSAFILLIALSTGLLGAAVMANLHGILHQELHKRLAGMLRTAALQVDAGRLGALADPAQENGPDYLAVKQPLQAVKAANPELRFVYTMRRDERKRPVFVVDAETDPKTVSHLGEVYDDPSAALDQALDCREPGRVFVDREPNADRWGSWLSGFVVLADADGRAAGVLGMDIAAGDIAAGEWSVTSLILAISVGVGLVVVLLGVALSRRITRPLMLLEADMDRITKFQIDQNTPVRSAFREIILMSEAVDDMKASLRAFKRYVPADLVAELIILRKEAGLGGERRELTVLFSDIENFTTWSEKLPPERLIQVMAGYFRGMTSIIHAHQGTVDKYIGDAIMAFWGAPAPLADHAGPAAAAALECVAFQRDFNRELEAQGLPPINTRFGLNSGDMLVGNVGYEERLNYTVIGDQVNLASRLESLNKLYGTRIIVSENTRLRLGGACLTRPLDNVVVKGKTESIAIHELLARAADAGAAELGLAGAGAAAYDLYCRRDWAAAEAAYAAILEGRPADSAARLMRERCRGFVSAPPGADWKGVIYLHEK